MESLNSYMAAEAFPGELRRRLREYFNHHKVVRIAQARRELLDNMSPMLQGEVAWHVHHGWLMRVVFLHGAQQQFLVEVATHLRAIVFAPADMIPNGCLYIIHEGHVSLQKTKLQKGAWWGEDMVLHSVHLRSRFVARSITFSTCFFIDRDTLMNLAARYPATLKQIRRFAGMIALRRELILRARVQNIFMAKKRMEGCLLQPSEVLLGFGDQTTPDGLEFQKLLSNATQAVSQYVVEPLLGGDAEKVRQGNYLTQVTKDMAAQSEDVRSIQENMNSLAVAQESMQERMASMMMSMQEQIASVAAAVDSLSAGAATGQMKPAAARLQPAAAQLDVITTTPSMPLPAMPPTRVVSGHLWPIPQATTTAADRHRDRSPPLGQDPMRDA